MSVSSIAGSGLFASMRELEVSASNVANASTPGFSPSQAVLSAAAGGGVASRVEAAPITGSLLSGTDLVAETVNAISAQRSFMANLTVLRAEQEMTSALVDLKR